MRQAFAYIGRGRSLFEDLDPNAQRISKFMGASHEIFEPYNIISEEKKKDSAKNTQPVVLSASNKNNNSQSTVDVDDPQPFIFAV